jgi:hypothetical protein
MKKLLFLFLIMLTCSITIAQTYTSQYTGVQIDNGITKAIQAGGALAANKTVNLTSAMTAATIQDSINAQPKNLGSYILVFQFADGTYNLNAALTFSLFYNGIIYIQGNVTEAVTKHTNQAVILNFTGDGLILSDVIALCYCKWLKISITTGTGIYLTGCNHVQVLYSYLLGNSTGSGSGLTALHTNHLFFRECYFSNLQNCVFAAYSPLVFSLSNSVTGTTPAVGLAADQGTTIAKYDATQPAATTPEQATHGGVIR